MTLTDEPITETQEVEDLTFVDVSADGRPVGIEVIGLGRAWALEEILNRYDISDFDARQLRSQFSGTAPTVSLTART